MCNIPSNGKSSRDVGLTQISQRGVICVYMKNLLLCTTLNYALSTAEVNSSRPAATGESFCCVIAKWLNNLSHMNNSLSKFFSIGRYSHLGPICQDYKCTWWVWQPIFNVCHTKQICSEHHVLVKFKHMEYIYIYIYIYVSEFYTWLANELHMSDM